MIEIKREPTSPGKILSEEFLVPMGLTQVALARHMGIDVKVVNRICNAKSSVTPEMAIRLEDALGMPTQFWLNAQISVDIWNARSNLNHLPGRIAG